ncbi:MAG: DedA family protein [Clostridiales bacterium]|nr:DedA family protein [Clostridiales bacterium]
MEQFIIEIINSFGYIGIFLLITIENIFPPIPSEVILTFGGFSTIITELTIIGVIVSSVLGSVIGAVILYSIGRLLNKEKLQKIVDGKIGNILRLNINDIEKAFNSFEKHGRKTVFICRFIPVLRSLISIPAGMTKMKFIPFITLTTFGSTIWNIVLIKLGQMAGTSWNKILFYVERYSTLAIIALVLIILIVIYNKYFQKEKIYNIKINKEGEI